MVRKPKKMPRLAAPTYSKGPDNTTRVPKKRKPRKPKMPKLAAPTYSKGPDNTTRVPKKRKPRKPRPGTPTLGKTIKRPTPARPMNRRKTR